MGNQTIKEFYNPVSDDNRIFTRDEIGKMSLEEFQKNKDAIMYQYENLGVPYERQLKNNSDVVFVHEYRREDGTIVKSHYRSKPDGIKEDTKVLNGKAQYNSLLLDVKNRVKEKFFPKANDNNLNFIDIVSEIINSNERKNYKEKYIDNILNNYVEENNIPFKYKNDLRHRAGSALIAKHTGDTDTARLWGNLKEMYDLLIGKENDTNIDTINNAIGRNYYLENQNASERELIDMIYKDIKNNTVFNIDSQLTELPLQNIFYKINKITYPIHKKFFK